MSGHYHQIVLYLLFVCAKVWRRLQLKQLVKLMVKKRRASDKVQIQTGKSKRCKALLLYTNYFDQVIAHASCVRLVDSASNLVNTYYKLLAHTHV